MPKLSDFEKELIFDYCLGLESSENHDEVKSLIENNDEALELYDAIKKSLSPLDSLTAQECPEYIVERAIDRLCKAANSSHIKLQELLGDEQSQHVGKVHFRPNLSQVVTAAAVIFFVATVFFPVLKSARQNSWKQKCQWQLSQIAGGLSNYSADHDNRLPSVATANGQPWWKVGCNEQGNCSNTRNTWLLVKEGYVIPANFVCPGVRDGKVLQFDALQAKQYNDFPARKYITYSSKILAKRDTIISLGRNPFFSDSNPLFENLPQNNHKTLKLRLNKKLLTINSINHNRKGQNVLFVDGSVEYTKNRNIGPNKDDIFTLQNTDVYNGYEIPVSEADSFLAP
ncbi:MAG: hypothetical protein KAS96_06115 [Planctomycetes bacterium]|nr:hypothetical protein [Planctomycetota bacterium]